MDKQVIVEADDIIRIVGGEMDMLVIVYILDYFRVAYCIALRLLISLICLRRCMLVASSSWPAGIPG